MSTNAHAFRLLVEKSRLTRAEVARRMKVTERTIYAWLSRPTSANHRVIPESMFELAKLILKK